jgi:hypothetical protein
MFLRFSVGIVYVKKTFKCNYANTIRICIFSRGAQKIVMTAGTMESNRTPQRFSGGMGSRRGLKGPQETMMISHMERGSHGRPKV